MMRRARALALEFLSRHRREDALGAYQEALPTRTATMRVRRS